MLTVFIADDSAVLRGRLKEALEELGTIKIIGESGDAEHAITEIRRLNPQVVIIDIRMPGGGGLPVLKDIKSGKPIRTAVILTSFPYQQYREAYNEAGADFFFDKTQDIPKMLSMFTDLANRPAIKAV